MAVMLWRTRGSTCLKVCPPPRHAPFEQPAEPQSIEVSVYWHVPSLHMPLPGVTSIVPLQCGAGGALQTMPAHVSPVHTPFMQPLGHCVSIGA